MSIVLKTNKNYTDHKH